MTVPAGTNFMLSSKANLQNGPDSVQLTLGGAVVDALAYGSFGIYSVPAGEGPAALDPGGSLQSLCRLPNGNDTENNAADFGFASRTPGAPN